MKNFREFVDPDSARPIDAVARDGDVVRMRVFGLDVAALLIPSEVLSEDRVSRIVRVLNLLDGREALVIAVAERDEG